MRVAFDVEASGAQRNKAHPFDPRNKMCSIGFINIDTGEKKTWKIEYDNDPYGDNLKEIQEWLNKTTLLIGFNIKYDLHWIRRYGLTFDTFNNRIFDCQVAYYILTAQQNPYPALDEVATWLGQENKLDVVKEQYWNKGFDTDEVPYQILDEYLNQDLVVTQQVYLGLESLIASSTLKQQKLINMTMLDTIVLEDIEFNGLQLNKAKSIRKGDELGRAIQRNDEQFKQLTTFDWFNLNSNDHLSAFLYGGRIKVKEREDYLFTYKDPKKEPVWKNRPVENWYEFPRLIEPLENTQLAKEGFYSTNEGTLKALLEKADDKVKDIIHKILARAKLEKRRSTYYHGLPKTIAAMGWEDDVVHSNFNQCVAKTGRLSSTKPNVQNIEDKVKEIYVSRFRRYS